MDPITTGVIIGLLVVYAGVICIVLYKLLSKLDISNILILVLLYIYGLVIAVGLPVVILHEKVYYNHIYPFMDWLIYVYGR